MKRKEKELKETLSKLIWLRTGVYPHDNTENYTLEKLIWLYTGEYPTIEGDDNGAEPQATVCT